MFDLDPITDVILTFSLGLGALLVGVVGLLVKRLRSGTIGWALPLGLSVLLAGPALGLALTDSTLSSLLPLGLLSGFFALLALVRMSVLASGIRVGAGLLRRSWAPSTSLALLGLCLIAWQVLALDRQLNRELDSADTTLRGSVPRGVEPNPGRAVRTDTGRQVQLMRLVQEPDAVYPEETSYIRSLGLDNQVIQTGPQDDSYNCHGWVFAEGKGWVTGTSVDSILEDNQYHTISKPQPGDVVVFRNTAGQVTHSGMVRTVLDDGGILVESKWGLMGRYIHTLEQHAYRNHQPGFYRSNRMGHQLRI